MQRDQRARSTLNGVDAMRERPIKRRRSEPCALDLAALAQELATLPPAERIPRKNTKRSLIAQLRGPLIAALVDRQYSFAALAKVLGQRGIDIHPVTLRHYLGPIDRSARRTVSGG